MKWKPVVSYENYEVSTTGRIRRVGSSIMLRPCLRNGYLCVSLWKNNKGKTLYVHRIVAEAFLHKVEGWNVVNHKDEDRLNNHVDNLEWCTSQYNNEYSLAKVWSVLSPQGDVLNITNLSKFCKEAGLNTSSMYEVMSGKRKSHKGFRRV